MKHVLIKGAYTVAQDGEYVSDIYVSNGKITHIQKIDSAQKKPVQNNTLGYTQKSDYQIIDGEGLVALPGGVDPHTHFDLDIGITRASDDFFTGTVAAACGGTTTIIDHMAFGAKDCLPTEQLVHYHTLAQNKAVIDYGFHGVIQSSKDAVLADLQQLKKSGVTSVKGYMTYDYKLSDSDLLRILQKTRELGMLFCVHAENHDIIAYLRTFYAANGNISPEYHPKSRPPECEAEAVFRISTIAHLAKDAPLYIVHLSSEQGLQALQSIRQNGQKNVLAETCPQYLFLDDSLYNEPNKGGLKYVMSPPLRKKNDNQILFDALKNNQIQTIGTDHCPFFLSEKIRISGGDFTKCPNGAPGVQLRMSLLFSQVQNGAVTLRQMTDWCCANPAKIFGLYPQKGCISVGSDADIVLFNPSQTLKITQSILSEHCDYTPYEGIELCGVPILVFSRGECIAKNGKSVHNISAGRGLFLPRKNYKELP